MFNLIVRSVAWTTGTETMPSDRVFEYTDEPLAEDLRTAGAVDFNKLSRLPCLFMEEGIDDQIAYVGTITRARTTAPFQVTFDYTIDSDAPPLRNSFIYNHRQALGISNDFEFSRNHWAVKDVDLFRVLLRTVNQRRQRPTVFTLADHENIEPTLVSAMMPFSAEFDPVYECIRQAATNANLRCRRADDMWENPAVMQDVASLIDRSRIVVCDCSNRNPNVFYEAGIAHTLGREVILITQSEQDIPFDLRHLRHVRYLNNEEGRNALMAALEARMNTITGH